MHILIGPQEELKQLKHRGAELRQSLQAIANHENWRQRHRESLSGIEFSWLGSMELLFLWRKEAS